MTELEDVSMDTECVCVASLPVVQESTHPYTDDTCLTGCVRLPGRRDLSILIYFRLSSLLSGFIGGVQQA